MKSNKLDSLTLILDSNDIAANQVAYATGYAAVLQMNDFWGCDISGTPITSVEKEGNKKNAE